MGQRLTPRINSNLLVRVTGTDADGNKFKSFCETADVSEAGVRIAGVYLRLSIGSMLTLQRGAKQAQYRVTWAGKPGTDSAGEAGLEWVAGDLDLFEVDLPDAENDDYEPSPRNKERRRFPRYACEFGVEVRAGAGPAMHAKCSDISRSGCYLETWSPLPVGTKVAMLLRLPNHNVEACGEVRSVDPAFGMGIEFVAIIHEAEFNSYLDEHEWCTGTIHAPDKPFSADQQRDSLAEAAELDVENDADQQLPRCRILLADDSRFLRSAYALYLRRAGYEVLLADDGEQALHLAMTVLPDVIVLDLLMPKIGGVAALGLLKQHPETAAIPVIVLSGLPSSNSGKLRSVGAFAYVPKTQVGPEELPEYIVSALQKRSASSLEQAGPSADTFARA